MRLCTGWITLSFLGAAALAQSGEPFPFKAQVTAEKAFVRSGPGDDFYPTSEISRGDEVQVYWQNEDGWFAVRPPAGSFSWLPAKALEATAENHVAEVTKKNVPAQIGTVLGDQRNAAQVQLDPGELVEILETVEANDERWYKIAPPAGEFRWIRGDAIAQQPRNSQERVQDVMLVEPVPLDNVSLPSTHVQQATSNQLVSWTARPGSDAKDRSSTTSSAAQPRWRKPGENAKPHTGAAAPTSARNAGTSSEPTPSGQVQPGGMASNATLLDLEVALSRIVAGPKSTWRLEPLRSRARSLADYATSSSEHNRARKLLEDIAKFEQIRLRSEHLGIEPLTPTPEPFSQETDDFAAAKLPDPASAGAEIAANPNYDGSGWLMPVVTQRRDVPQYALTDDYGRILKFVTPTPGLNLRRYLRKQIAVRGTQRSVPQLYRPHLMAERVMELDRQRR